MPATSADRAGGALDRADHVGLRGRAQAEPQRALDRHDEDPVGLHAERGAVGVVGEDRHEEAAVVPRVAELVARGGHVESVHAFVQQAHEDRALGVHRLAQRLLDEQPRDRRHAAAVAVAPRAAARVRQGRRDARALGGVRHQRDQRADAQAVVRERLARAPRDEDERAVGDGFERGDGAQRALLPYAL
jgi:hypothetical protein